MTVLAAISLVVWAYLLAARGGFWRTRTNCANPALHAHVVAVVPARNEAETIATAVVSLLRQQGAEVRVVLVDDASTDGTAQIARTAAESNGSLDHLLVVPGAPLPIGWTGKLWAVQQGIERALTFAPDFLLLTDADIEHGPRVVAALTGKAEEEGIDLVSNMVKLRCESVPERLLIPAFVYFFFQLYPPAWVADPNAKTAGAAGGCMLLRPLALDRAGGMEAIRDRIIDDCALAQSIKRSGGRVWLGLTQASRSLRSYGSFAEIGRMIARTAFNQLNHSALLLALTVIGLLITYVAPVVAVASGQRPPMMLGGAAWAAMTITYLPIVRSYGVNPLWALTLPVSALFYLSATVWSAVRYWSGRGGEWKGRAQDRKE